MANASKRIRLSQIAYVPRFMRGIQFRSRKDRLDAVHKAQHVEKRDRFSVQNLDAFTLKQ